MPTRPAQGRSGALPAILAPILLIVASPVGCAREGSLPAGDQAVRVVAPAPGEVMTTNEGVFAVLTDREDGEMRFRLSGRDVTSSFQVASRNEKMGGGLLHVAWLTLSDLVPEGENTFEVESRFGERAHRASVRFRVEPPDLALIYDIVEEGPDGPVPSAGRLTFIGVDGTPDPNLASPSMPVVDPVGRENTRSFVESDTGSGWVGLPAGGYAVVASRGLRDSISVARLSGRGPQKQRFVLRRLGMGEEWACDFHVHGLASSDSTLPPRPRLRAFRAGGVDLLVAADHNVIADYGPYLDSGRGLTTVPGIEAGIQSGAGPGSRSIGHWTAWPLAAVGDGGREAGGLVRAELPPLRGEEAHVLYDRLARFLDPDVGRALAEAGQPLRPLLQLNHPRGIQSPQGAVQRDKAYFEFLALPRERTPAARGALPDRLLQADRDSHTTNLSFDAIELYNRASLSLYLETRADYFSLLRNGVVKTATGNTDSHATADVLAGAPVNLVRPGRSLPRPSEGREGWARGIAALMVAVRAGRVVVTTGPALDIEAVAGDRHAGPGELVATGATALRVRVRVVAPEWIPVEEVRWYVDGKLVASDPLEAPVSREPDPPAEGERVRRREWVRTRSFTWTGDGFLWIEAGERLPENPTAAAPGRSAYAHIAPGQWSIAFANPIRVDADGDGVWNPGETR